MAIDKESSGLPEVDFKRRTTKVNLGIIVAGAVFYAITFALAIYYMRDSDAERYRPSPPVQSAPAANAAEPANGGGRK